MKVKAIALTVVFSALGLLVSSAANASITPYTNTRIDYLNWEDIGLDYDDVLGGIQVGVDAGTIGKLEIGDTLDGVLQVQTLGDGLFGAGVGATNVWGVFSVVVTTKVPSAAILGGFEMGFSPNAAFAAALNLPANTMIAIYSNSAGQNTGSHAANVAAITSGTLELAAGIAAATDYWMSATNTDVPALLQAGSAEYFAGLSVLGGAVLGNVIPQVSPFLGPTGPSIALPFIGVLNDFVLEGDVSPIQNSPTVYGVFSDDPSLVMIPEPGSFLVWSILGILVAVAVRRRRA